MVRLTDLNDELASLERSKLARFVAHYVFFLVKLSFSLWGAL